MIAEAAQAAAEVVKQHAASTETLIGLGLLIVSNVGLWLDRIVTISKNRAEQEKAEADEARSEAAAKPAQNGNGIHEKYVLPHSLKIQELEGRANTTDANFEKFERENRAQHETLFGKVDEVKDLILRRLPRAGD